MPIIAPRTRNRLLLGLFILGLAVLTNWIFPYEAAGLVETDKVYGDPMFSTGYDFQNLKQAQEDMGIKGEFRAGGWPCKFYYSSVAHNGQILTATSWLALLANIAIWGGILAVVLGYEFWVSRHRTSKNEDNARSLSLSDLLLLVTSVALLLVYGRQIHALGQHHDEVANRIVAATGGTIRTAYLPNWLVGRLPKAAETSLLRLTRAELIEPSTEDVREVLELGTVRDLLLSGGDYDLRVLDELRKQTTLEYLRIAGRELDAQTLAAVGAAKQLRGISLIYTNVTEDGLAAWGEMPVLRAVDLFNTDITLNSETPPAWGASVERLRIPSACAPTGHRLQGWPHLRYLTVRDMDTIQSNQVLEVTLRNLPELVRFQLDTGYLSDLTMEDVPKLHSFEPTGNKAQGVAQGKRVVVYPRLSELKVSGAPSIQKLIVDAEKLDLFQVSGEPDLEFSLSLIGNEEKQYNRDADVARGDFLSAAKRQEWVDSFANCDGFQTANLSKLDLSDLDLTSLSKNRSITKVALAYTNVKAQQLVDLRAGEQLERIDVRGSEVSGADVEKLLSAMPQLKELLIDSVQLGRLRITDHESVELLVGRRTPSYSTTDALHLENVPKLREVFELAPGTVYVNATGAPALRGLIFQSAMPKRVNLEGLRDLEFFAAGGAGVTNEQAQEVLACKRLRKLTLAHTKVDPAVLNQLSQLSELEYLCLTGTPLTDEIVRSLSGLTKFKHLRLDRTGAKEDDLMSLCAGLSGLDELGVSQVSSRFVEVLRKFPELQSLTLSDTVIDGELMAAICSLTMLGSLSLDGCTLDEESALLLANKLPDSVMKISLKEAKVSGAFLQKLASDRQMLEWTVDNLETDPVAMDFIMLNARVQGGDGMLWRMWSSMGMQVFEVENEAAYETLGEVEPFMFSEEYTERVLAQGGFPRFQPPNTTPLGSY